MSSSHGPQYDEFGAQSGEHHGGALFDEFGKPSPAGNKHGGQLWEQFRDVQGAPDHGARWDEFPWRSMPAEHGHSFDSNFDAPAAHDGHDGHGTWHDVFRGAAVRVIHCGADLEGTVVNTGHDTMLVKPRDGREPVEVGLMQVREWARLDNSGSPDRKGIRTAHPGNTPAPFTPTADPGPSVHNRKARGGGPRQEVNVDTGAKTANKADDQGLDVEKTVAALRELVAKLEA